MIGMPSPHATTRANLLAPLPLPRYSTILPIKPQKEHSE